ncbi:MAG: recombinase family protein [Oscillospiraceae bacterium]|nr:recombinase family protein [Oscillospiraceae bacterium]
MENRVYCLYRVSTDKQVDYNDSHQADIPMQRRECHRFAEEHGWVIIHEEQEDGVSGHKVRAENRDKLQIIKEHARQGKFDILLVFMFDRIGRIADETPFVVEWFVRNGIRVWSTQEGEQRFDSHTDKLTNYIRFWQADGESEKTSIRTKTALGQLTEDGRFMGGSAPYGYDLVNSGILNKRKHEVFALAVNKSEAAVVRMIFDKYVNEGYGAQRIATWLNNQGYRARSGKPWHHASIRGILCNLTYTGVLRSGDSRSPVQQHLQIITAEQYAIAQRIREARADSASENPRVPLNTRGSSLLAGNVYCGHCGSRLALTTNGKPYPCAADPNRVVKRIRYICYGKTRKQTECDGQTGYTAHILDGIVDKVVHHIFEQMWTVNKSEIVSQSYRERMAERKALLESAKREHAKAADELATLRAEVVKAIRGESSFSTDTLGTLIREAEDKCAALEQKLKSAQAAYDEGQALMASLNTQYDAIIGWSELYDGASIETKKMIVSCLIKRIDVYRDYRVHIDWGIDFDQFQFGLDLSRKEEAAKTA